MITVYILPFGKKRYSAYICRDNELDMLLPKTEDRAVWRDDKEAQGRIEKAGFSIQTTNPDAPRFFFKAENVSRREQLKSVALKVIDRYMPYAGKWGDVHVLEVDGTQPSTVLLKTISYEAYE